ncbi:arrestin domain-containing protein 3-like [Tubulanus polymorphus]|uniref:arrestin domain-containing protein 3-like n=1 Tax=Tubulanus polymorphus TaxID=672921 RepID=UPI003DA41087
MGKISLISVDIDRPNGVYIAGEYINGTLTVDVAEPLKVRGVQIKFKGFAKVHWTEQHGSGKNRHTVHYHNEETYFNEKRVVLGRGTKESGEDTVMTPQRYQFPFQFVIPHHIPSSFEGVHGRVRYHIKGKVDIPMAFDKEFQRPFTIIANVDLNQMPTARQALQNEDQKTLCCCCCESGPISAVIRVDKTGYVPGEGIRISGEITNNSNNKMDSSKVVIDQRIAFHATSKTRWTSSHIAKIKKGEIAPGGTEVWTGEAIQIPPCPPSMLQGCNIIDVIYVLKLVVDPSGPSFDLEVPIEIVIGTIPLRDFFYPYTQAPAHMNIAQPGGFGMQQPVASAPPAPVSNDLYPPPPSYAECVYGEGGSAFKDDNDKHQPFVPTYAYYGWT